MNPINHINQANCGVQLIDPIKDPRWDKFVEAHPFGWICHLSGWKKVLEQSFNHMKGYYFVLMDRSGKIKAGLPVFHVRSWITGNRMVSVPFGTLFDPLVSSPRTLDMLLSRVFVLQRTMKARYTEIRTLHTADLFQGVSAISLYKHHFLMLDREPEQLKRTFHRSCVRQRISRGIKSGLCMKTGKNESDLQEFYRLQLMTRKRHNLPTQPYRFFRLLWNTFYPSGRVCVLLALKDDRTVAAMMLFKFRNRVSVEYAASDDFFMKMSPNHFLFWKAIKLAWQEGYKMFDFGRTASDNKGLMDFKRRWGTQEVDLPQVFLPENACNEAAVNGWKRRLVMQLCRYAPDVFQKIIGDFCYHHLG